MSPDDDDVDTDREVGGITYELLFVREDKGAALAEASMQRTMNNKFARVMRVNVGEFKGKWGVYVSRIQRGQ